MLIDIDLEMEKGSYSKNIDLSTILQNEEMIGLKFHSDYIEFLQKFNGGVPIKPYFDFSNNTKVVERFLCILKNYKEDSNGMYDVGVVWSQIEDRLNEYLVPFAVLFAGDFLCFDYEEHPNNPKVVLWNHDLSDERKPHTEFVANNLNAFLQMLYYKSDEEILADD
jgi:SMI1-KNR4 cell-wall